MVNMRFVIAAILCVAAVQARAQSFEQQLFQFSQNAAATARQTRQVFLNTQATAIQGLPAADIRRAVMVEFAHSHAIAVVLMGTEKVCSVAASGAASRQRSEDLIQFMTIARREYGWLSAKLKELAASTGGNEERRMLSRELAGNIRGVVDLQKKALAACAANPQTQDAAILVREMDFAPLVRDAEAFEAAMQGP